MFKSRIAAVAVAFVILASITGSAFAQDKGIMVTALGAYQWGGTLKGWDGEARLLDAGSWGIALDIPIRPDTYLELIYTRQVTDLTYREYGLGEPAQEVFDIAVEYYQVGGLYTVSKDGPKPFGTMTIGATRFAPQSSMYGSEWKFSAALGLGVIVPVTPRIGLRMHARLLLPFMYAGGGMWCGTGGCSIGVSGGSAIVQGDVALGLVIRL
ncbi:MAG: hypothetical protein KAU49_02230 [Candidatus Krumholzibacteria bacterium]|nr:hypothetical protein [Candidatus Krumholzibacteria bacterium]